jgi:hypothetical protein
MIRFDGYYRKTPTLYEDGIANHWVKGYMHRAFYFLPNGLFLRASKNSESKQLDFSKLDFNPDYPNKYEIIGNKLEMFFETGTVWEFSEVLEIVSQEELKGGKGELYFVKFI